MFFPDEIWPIEIRLEWEGEKEKKCLQQQEVELRFLKRLEGWLWFVHLRKYDPFGSKQTLFCLVLCSKHWMESNKPEEKEDNREKKPTNTLGIAANIQRNNNKSDCLVQPNENEHWTC